VYYYASVGDDILDQAPDSSHVGHMIADHIEDWTGNLVASDFENAIVKSADIGTLITDDTAPASWRNLDVTSQVRTDHAEGDVDDTSCYRLRQSTEPDAYAQADVSNYWLIYSSRSGTNPPYLLLTLTTSSSCSSSSSYSSSCSSCSSRTATYTRDDRVALPGDDANLDTPFTPSEYDDVAQDDDVYVVQCAAGPAQPYSIFLWKNAHGNDKDIIMPECRLKTSIAPSASTVYLQIYNRTTTNWETLDSNNTADANVEFTLLGIQSSNLSSYYDDNNFVACRVYQEAQ